MPRDAHLSQADVKQAYHRTLLKIHPDKVKRYQAGNEVTIEGDEGTDIALLREAYSTLSDPDARRKYDLSLRKDQAAGPRPAQVVSLDDFTQDVDPSLRDDVYIYSCRCGGRYKITETQLGEDVHLVGCDACSEVIWVGYDVADEENGES